MTKEKGPARWPLLVYSKPIGRDGTSADVQTISPPQGAMRDALDLTGAVPRDDRAPFADGGGADAERPRDIRGALKVINNIGFEHDASFTVVKDRSQPRFTRPGLTSFDMDKLSTISERIKDAMSSAGVSASELARACGVSPAAVHKWLNGGKLSADNLFSAARALGVREEWLRTGKLPRDREHSEDDRRIDQVIEILGRLRGPLADLSEAIDQLTNKETPAAHRRQKGGRRD